MTSTLSAPDSLTKAIALENVGGLSAPSKMPCYGWSISATLCKVGAKLHEVKGSVCEHCYALRNRYLFANVQGAMTRRLGKFYGDAFVPSMVYLLKSLSQSYFRWFDSGDLQDVAMLARIAEIAEQTPETKHWLPTKEYDIVTQYLAEGKPFPANLNVRLSGYMMDKAGPVSIAKRLGVTISEVRKENFTCPSSMQDNACGTCRACWNPAVFNVVYKRH